MRKATLVIGSLIIATLPAHEARAAVTLAGARGEADQGYFDSALTAIDKYLRKHPHDEEARLLEAQILGWRKDYEASEKQFTDLLNQYPLDPDILVGRGYLYYAEDKLDAADQDFASALNISPTYDDALQGRQLVQKAKDGASDGQYPWQIDAGSEFSTFARAPATNWDNELVQLTRKFADSGTALHVAVQRYHEFEETDEYYEIGVDQVFTPYLNGYFYGGGTPDAAFRPTWHVADGGAVRLNEPDPVALWATFDGRYDDYPATQVGNLNPGARLEFADEWALSGLLIDVLQSGSPPLYGWQARLDGRFMPGWRFFAGLAYAPETVDGATVRTQTQFGGMAYDIDDADTVTGGYTRDDRQHSWIRNAVNADLAHRF